MLFWCFLVLLLVSAPIRAAPVIQSFAAVVMEESSGRVLYGKNMHEIRSVASLTKIMTTLMALEMGSSSSLVSVSRGASSVNGARIGLSFGDQVNFDALTKAMFFRSGNDGAIAIAEHVAGCVGSFVEIMNQNARKLGLSHTQFRNPHGLDQGGHYSTAYDMAVLTRYALQNKAFAELARTNVLSLQLAGRRQDVWNINSFLWRFEGATGVKTGYTGGAGYCLAASAKREGKTLILVVLGASTSNQRWNDAITLLNYCFSHLGTLLGDVPTLTYVVQPGDTLWDISQYYSVSIADIVSVNGLEDPNRIRRGQVLTIPK